jgi:hypothetical protein
MLDINYDKLKWIIEPKKKREEGSKMPRIRRLIINDETAVYHTWDVEPNSPCHSSI